MVGHRRRMQAEALEGLDFAAVKADITALMTSPDEAWPAGASASASLLWRVAPVPTAPR